MPDWSLLGRAQQIENWGAATTVSHGTTITASATANTKGAYAQLTAATGFEVDVILVMVDDSSATIDYLVDLAVGAAGSEVVIANNLLVSGGTGSISYGMKYRLNVAVKAGERIAARCQASTLSSVVRISCLAFGQSFFASSPLSLVTTYGANLTDSGGTSVDPGGTANTKGAYSQITASTTAPIRELILGIGSDKNATRSSQSWLVDVAIGAAGSEQIIWPNVALNCSTSPDIITPQEYGPLPASIPTGTRIAVRAQSDGIDAVDRLFDVIAYGIS